MFQCKELDPIDGRPKHETPRRAREQAAKNALKIKSIFGGGHMGYLDMVTKPTALKWIVQKSKGILPTFPLGITNTRKRELIAKYMETEENILRADVTEKLLQTQSLKCVHDEYFCELERRTS